MQLLSKISLGLLLLLPAFFAQAQGGDRVWTLPDCIHYAQANNLGIKTAELDARSGKMIYEYSKYNRLPSLSLNSNFGTSFGRSINPTTNAFENTQFSSLGLSAGANVLLFGWFEKKYAIQKSKLQYQSAGLQVAQQKNELVLTVATAYLRVLLAKEQTNNIVYQIAISQAGKERIARLLDAGKSNVLELSQAATQLSTDSSAYFQSLLNQEQALIDLKAILNLDMATVIQTDTAMDKTQGFMEKPVAEQIYQAALGHRPEIKNNLYKTAMAQKDIDLAKSSLYPKLSMYVSSGTNYSSSFYETLPNGERQLMNFGRQFQNNISQSVGIGLSIPLFNNFSTQQNIKTAKLGLERVIIANEETQLKLKQDIYKAVMDYELTRQKFWASESALANAELAFKAASLRFENGLINQFEYITEKNNYLRIQNETTALKYDLYFKKLVIDYYMDEQY